MCEVHEVFRRAFSQGSMIPIVTGEYAMKLSKQVLILLLCCLLVRFHGAAESFGPTGQSNEQRHAARATVSQELQQLVARSRCTRTPSLRRFSACHLSAEVVGADAWMQSHPTSRVKSWPRSRQAALGPQRKGLNNFPGS